VLAVSYAKGCRIHRVRVVQLKRGRHVKRADRQVIILSRKVLNELGLGLAARSTGRTRPASAALCHA
jgi:hypothetical protein